MKNFPGGELSLRLYMYIMGLDVRNLSLVVCEQQSADQPAHPCRLIKAFVIPLLESIISRLARREISIFQLVSVAEQAGLNLTF